MKTKRVKLFNLISLILISLAFIFLINFAKGAFSVGEFTVRQIPQPVCGDGTINQAVGIEQCDLTALNGKTCPDFSLSLGTLACYSNCTFDLRNCYNPEPPSPGGGGGGGGGIELCEKKIKRFVFLTPQSYNEEFCEGDTITIILKDASETNISLRAVNEKQDSVLLKLPSMNFTMKGFQLIDLNNDNTKDLAIFVIDVYKKKNVNMTLTYLEQPIQIEEPAPIPVVLCPNKVCDSGERCTCPKDCKDYSWLILLILSSIIFIISSTELAKKLAGKNKLEIKQILKEKWYLIALIVVFLGSSIYIGIKRFAYLYLGSMPLMALISLALLAIITIISLVFIIRKYVKEREKSYNLILLALTSAINSLAVSLFFLTPCLSSCEKLMIKAPIFILALADLNLIIWLIVKFIKKESILDLYSFLLSIYSAISAISFITYEAIIAFDKSDCRTKPIFALIILIGYVFGIIVYFLAKKKREGRKFIKPRKIFERKMLEKKMQEKKISSEKERQIKETIKLAYLRGYTKEQVKQKFLENKWPQALFEAYL